MTYDELLATINSENYRNSRTLDTPYAALRTIVELHKPQPSAFDDTECAECSSEELSVIYPCPTIQAIEKELI